MKKINIAIGIIVFLELGTIIAFVVEQNLWGFVFITMALMFVLYRLLLKRKQILNKKKVNRILFTFNKLESQMILFTN
jgi:hypothetical protein